jgi:hypothetical protein
MSWEMPKRMGWHSLTEIEKRKGWEWGWHWPMGIMTNLN